MKEAHELISTATSEARLLLRAACEPFQRPQRTSFVFSFCRAPACHHRPGGSVYTGLVPVSMSEALTAVDSHHPVDGPSPPSSGGPQDLHSCGPLDCNRWGGQLWPATNSRTPHTHTQHIPANTNPRPPLSVIKNYLLVLELWPEGQAFGLMNTLGASKMLYWDRSQEMPACALHPPSFRLLVSSRKERIQLSGTPIFVTDTQETLPRCPA